LEQGNFELARWLCAEDQGLEPTKQSRDICQASVGDTVIGCVVVPCSHVASCLLLQDLHNKRLVDLRLPDYQVLLEACEENDVATVAKAVSGGTAPHHVYADGKTPLMGACSFGCAAVVDYLVDLTPGTYRGPSMQTSVKYQAKDGTSALLLAAYRGLVGIVESLLKFAANVDPSLEVLREILDARLPNGSNALIAAAQAKQTGVVEVLLAYGANANAVKPDGIGTLYTAAGAGNVDIIRLLLSPPASRIVTHPADRDAYGQPRGADVNLLTARGSSALHVAAQCSHVETVEFLLQSKADLNVRSVSGSTPLALAVFHCDPRLVELLLRQPGIELDHHHSQGNTEAMMAAWCGDVDILTMLLDAGASSTITNDEGNSVESILRNSHSLTLAEARDKAHKLREAAAEGNGGDTSYSDFTEAAREAFSMCDTSGDGLISADELVSV